VQGQVQEDNVGVGDNGGCKKTMGVREAVERRTGEDDNVGVGDKDGCKKACKKATLGWETRACARGRQGVGEERYGEGQVKMMMQGGLQPIN